MAVILGKRKRLAEKKPEQPRPKKKIEESEEYGDDDDEARALFQRAFEKKFQPLETSATPLEDEDSEDSADSIDSEEEDESDWSGLSGGEDDVEVVEHAKPALTDEEDLRLSKKKYMVS